MYGSPGQSRGRARTMPFLSIFFFLYCFFRGIKGALFPVP